MIVFVNIVVLNKERITFKGERIRVVRHFNTGRFKVLAVCIGCLLFTVLIFKDGQEPIRIHDDQVDVQKLTNAVVRLIIEKGYGYQVEYVESTIKEVRKKLTKGEVDVTLELWKENHLSWYQTGIKNNKLLDLGELYSKGKQYWIVSKWYAEEKNIVSVFDMRHHWKDFVDPGDPTKGIFLNCIVGWSCRDINSVKLKAYGLDRYYNGISPISPGALREMYKRSHEKKLPVFGYYWEPNSLMLKQDWYVLHEPPYDREVWKTLLEESQNPGEDTVEKGCAYAVSGASKIASTSLKSKAPDVLKMLSAMKIDIELFNSLLFSSEQSADGIRDFESIGRTFLTRHPETWSGWVDDKVRQQVVDALK